MKYIILVDSYENTQTEAHYFNEVGRTDGTRLTEPEEIEAYAKGMSYEFRIIDDDDGVYFKGKCDSPPSWADALSLRSDIGDICFDTEIDYRKVVCEEWKRL